jgi:RecG-like helicase
VTPLPADRIPIAQAHYRGRARIAGRVSTLRVQPHGGVGSLECTLTDESGGMVLVFLGRQDIAGIKVGARMVVEGTVGDDRGHLAMLNPWYELLPE